MPDIAMCDGKSKDGNIVCPRAHYCHRYTATSSGRRQAYFVFPMRVDGSCDHFWPNDMREPREPRTSNGGEG